MTKREQQRLFKQENTLCNLGFTLTETEQLRRISMALQRWHEHECNGNIERDEETGKTYWVNDDMGFGTPRRYAYPDKETGALKRLKAIIDRRNGNNPDPVSTYIQSDPRGAALYIIRPGDVPEGKEVNAYYSRGVAVY